MEMYLHLSQLTPGQNKLLANRDPFVLFAGGFGSAKSTALQLKAIQLKCENGLAPGLMMAETYAELYTNLVDPMLDKLRWTLSAREMPEKRADREGRRWLQWGDGSITHLRSAENENGYAGLNVAWLVGDELRLWRRRAYMVAIARVRVRAQRVQAVFASTPEIGFMSEQFNSGMKTHALIQAPTAENAHNLSPGFIDGLMASYSPRLRRAYLNGEFTILEGAVFEQFDPNPRTSQWCVDFEPSREWLNNHKVMLAVDPGFRRSAWLWIAERGPQDWVVFDEMVPDGMSAVANVAAANAHGHPVDEVWVDPAADQTEQVSGHDVISALRGLTPRHSGTRMIRTIDGFRSIEFGIDKARVLLGGYENLPIRVHFARRLAKLEEGKQRGILKDLGALRYPDDKDGRAVKDQPLKDGLHDHGCDAFRYWSVGRWLTCPELRKLDPELSKSTRTGYKTA